jgi:hypothetical protein
MLTVRSADELAAALRNQDRLIAEGLTIDTPPTLELTLHLPWALDLQIVHASHVNELRLPDGGQAGVHDEAVVTLIGPGKLVIDGRARCFVTDNAVAEVAGDGSVYAEDVAVVMASGRSKVYAQNMVSVVATDTAFVTLCDSTSAVGSDDCHMVALDDSRVTVSDRAAASASDRAVVTASGDAIVTLRGDATVNATDRVRVVDLRILAASDQASR